MNLIEARKKKFRYGSLAAKALCVSRSYYSELEHGRIPGKLLKEKINKVMEANVYE